ncbi:hypothetical protein GNX18_12585 [Microbulbifer sp. SH-1]|nr:hypothetical protein GNX18_12585 [Microbulbifer sp. SH-1]
MNKKEEYLLKNYQSLMKPYEKIVARWLVEEWNGIDQELPKWLINRVRLNFTMRDFGKPNSMARVICLNLLENHRHDISLPANKI